MTPHKYKAKPKSATITRSPIPRTRQAFIREPSLRNTLLGRRAFTQGITIEEARQIASSREPVVSRQQHNLSSQTAPSQRVAVSQSQVGQGSGGAFHPASPQVQSQLQANAIQRTNNPRINRFTSERAIRRYQLVNDIPVGSGSVLGTTNTSTQTSTTRDPRLFKQRLLLGG